MQEQKPGWKTSEFWLSLAAIVIGAVMASGVLDSLAGDHWLVKVVGIVASILGALGYTASRGFVKGKVVAAAAITEASKAQPKDP
jgi:hypothetical protein